MAGRNQNDENVVLNGRILTHGAYPVTQDNATNNVTISNVAPAGVGTATISKWLVIVINGVDYFIPMWT